MTARKRNRNKAKKGKKTKTAAGRTANHAQAPIEAQLHLQQLQIGNDDNATTTCRHGLVLPHHAIDKMKEMLTKQVLVRKHG